MPAFLFFILFVILGAGIIWLILYLEKIRRQKLAKAARELGFTYYPKSNYDFHDRFGGFELFQRGGSRRSYDLIEGRKDGADVKLFEYSYVTGSGKNRTTHRRVVCLLSLERGCGFPHTIIRPESIFDKVASAIGFNDIDFESIEFSRKYYVKGEDRRFAYDLVHPRMMEYLLKIGIICVETGGRNLLVHPDRKLSPKAWPSLYYTAKGFVEQIPDRLITGDW